MIKFITDATGDSLLVKILHSQEKLQYSDEKLWAEFPRKEKELLLTNAYRLSSDFEVEFRGKYVHRLVDLKDGRDFGFVERAYTINRLLGLEGTTIYTTDDNFNEVSKPHYESKYPKPLGYHSYTGKEKYEESSS